jgi:hypothetical protein
MSLRNRFGVFFFALTFVIACAYSFAEESTTDTACLTLDARPPVVKSFLLEHRVNVLTIDSTITAKLSRDVFSAIFILDPATGLQTIDPATGLPALNPDIEVRSRIEFTKETGILENDLFLRPKDADLPTTDQDFLDNIEAERFGFLKVDVDTVYTSCQPSPTVLAVGCVVAGVDIFLPPAGATYAYSFAYTPEPPETSNDPDPLKQRFRDAVSLTVGLGLLYQDHAPGSITFTHHDGLGHMTRSAAHCPR